MEREDKHEAGGFYFFCLGPLLEPRPHGSKGRAPELDHPECDIAMCRCMHVFLL